MNSMKGKEDLESEDRLNGFVHHIILLVFLLNDLSLIIFLPHFAMKHLI